VRKVDEIRRWYEIEDPDFLSSSRIVAMLQHISIDTLIPYERNNKIHDAEQIKKIAKSIKEL
jgi:hypothetical protein